MTFALVMECGKQTNRKHPKQGQGHVLALMCIRPHDGGNGSLPGPKIDSRSTVACSRAWMKEALTTGNDICPCYGMWKTNK